MTFCGAIFIVGGVLFGLVAGVSGWLHRHGEARAMLARWARKRRYTVESATIDFTRGPYFFRSWGGQVVFAVVLRDEGGAVRNASVRCGGWLQGIAGDAVHATFADGRDER